MDSTLANGHADGEVNGEADGGDHGQAQHNNTEDAEDQRRVHLTQHLFDLQYLRLVFGSSVDDGADLLNLISKSASQLDLTDNTSERLRRNASEYWKRTYLLFGLLAPGNVT